MNAKVDLAMIASLDLAFEKLKPVRRVSPGQARFDRVPKHLQMKTVWTWLERQRDADGWVADQLALISMDAIKANADDRCALGQLVERALLGLGETIGDDDEFWEDK